MEKKYKSMNKPHSCIQQCQVIKKQTSQIYTEPKSLDKFIINFDNDEFDILLGLFYLN